MKMPVIAAMFILLTALQLPAAGESHAASCLTPAAWHTWTDGTPRALPGPRLFAEMAQREVVLLGESHGTPEHHAWQLQTLAILHAVQPRMVIGFEAFPRRLQPVLDRWIAGELTAERFLTESEWDKVWRFPSALYLPLFQFARINRIPMLALNVERDLTRAVMREGWDAVPDGLKEGVTRPAPAPAAYLDTLFEAYRQHPGQDNAVRDSDGFRKFTQAQTTWDRALAEVLARAVTDRPGVLTVGIMGSGHVRNGHGVPHQLRNLGISSIGTLLPVNVSADCTDITPGLADAVFALPAPPPAP